ncbi:MAG TPA: hypothetical protein VGQ99_10450 [Tepidisphaeraceae bacterium]|jgi:hypothetical protein|nr:hypothetical protein [Tepidisphaeraceae bacterium]
MSRRVASITLLAAALLLGCDRPKPQQKAQTTTTVRPFYTIDPNPSTLPATRPIQSTLSIDGRELVFPAARLVLQQSEPTVDLLLFSDDPPNALSATYAGNRYYFDLKLEIDDLQKLAASDMHWKAASIERVDAPDGIFLEGDKKMLQPYDLRVAFSQTGPIYTIDFAGQFLLFQSKDEAAPSKTVLVRGTLLAELETKSKKREPATRPIAR